MVNAFFLSEKYKPWNIILCKHLLLVFNLSTFISFQKVQKNLLKTKVDVEIGLVTMGTSG